MSLHSRRDRDGWLITAQRPEVDDAAYARVAAAEAWTAGVRDGVLRVLSVDLVGLADQEDRFSRLVHLNALIKILPSLTSVAVDARRGLVRDLRDDGLTLADIRRATGMSRSRISEVSSSAGPAADLTADASA